MRSLVFNTEKGINYHWCGRFVPPSDSWIHMARKLVDYELVYVTEGTLYIACDKEEYEVRKGEYLLMPPAGLQQGTRQGACTFYWMHFDYDRNRNDHREVMYPKEGMPEGAIGQAPGGETEGGPGLQEYAGGEPGLYENAEVDRAQELAVPQGGVLKNPGRVIVLLTQLQDADKLYRDRVLNNALCTAVLSEIAMQICPDRERERSGEQRCEEIADYIKWHLGEELRVEGIARFFDYNAKYLTTFFKRHMGMPLKEYILLQKTEKAKALLSQTDITVAEAGYSLGFSDPHNFTSCFKKVCGMSPGAYRKLYGYFPENRV